MNALLSVRNLDLETPGGRPLVRGLTLQLAPRDRVALVGRNGVGKSTLLRVLAGDTSPERGRVWCSGRRILVPQRGAQVEGKSPGEVQREALQAAFSAQPQLLLLDEPTHDLDASGIRWLRSALARWDAGLLVVSHDRRLLREFENFFVVAESGCHHVCGSFDDLQDTLRIQAEREQAQYVRNLNALVAREHNHERTRRRRQRKANRGRIWELGRCTPRSVLNGKRSYAQESQGKRAQVQQARLDSARAWAKASRRALRVELPLEATLPALPSPAGPVATLDEVELRIDGRVILRNRSLSVTRERIAIVGPNGSGKTTLVRALIGELSPARGRAWCNPGRLAYIAQNATNWCLDESVLSILGTSASFDEAASILQAHRFPLALATRPLRELSPGERLRAALLAVLQRPLPPELLVLDEPTDHLDFGGLASLEALLRAWPGGLVVVSHDASFLEAVGIGHYVELVSKKPTEFPSGSCA